MSAGVRKRRTAATPGDAVRRAAAEAAPRLAEAAAQADRMLQRAAASLRLHRLAEWLDCLTEDDLCELCAITPVTAHAWRARHTGPVYALVGNRYLYPRAAVATFIEENTRERRKVPGKSLL